MSDLKELGEARAQLRHWLSKGVKGTAVKERIDELINRHQAAVKGAAADRIIELESEVERLRGEVGAAADALRDVGKAAITVKPTLEEPYRDAPDRSPWVQFMERPSRNAHNLGVRLHREVILGLPTAGEADGSTDE